VYATRPVYEIAPIPHRQRHWTPGRITSLIAVVLIGGSGWAVVAAGIADLATGGAVSALVIGLIGVGVLLAWTLVTVVVYSDETHYVYRAPRRAWRLVALTWLIALIVGILHLMSG
jgi:hypothetical protein